MAITLSDLLARTTPNGECLEIHCNKSKGYSRIRFGGRMQLAHRIAYQLTFGEIPGGLCVLHKCDNRPCVNTKHLFLGTYQDNSLDMYAKGRGNGKWEFCAKGHPLSGDNLSAGGRCRICKRAKEKRNYEKRKSIKK